MGALGGIAATATKAVLGVGLAAAGGVAAGLGVAVKAAGDFEQTMSGVKAASGATADQMGQLSGLALKLGKDTSFSAKEAAAGIEELVKGGLTIPDIMNGAAEATLNLAAAGGVSLPEAAEIAANAMSIFNLKGSDMAMVADQIAGAANASSMSVGDFRMSLAAAGTVLANAGQSFDQTATSIALMAQAGIKGADAGTSLKSMFNQLIPTTDKTKEAMAELGLVSKNNEAVMKALVERGVNPATAAMEDNEQQLFKLITGWDGMKKPTKEMNDAWEAAQKNLGLVSNAFVNADGSFKDASQIAGILKDKLGGLTEAQRSLALETIFGSDGMRAAVVLTKAGAEGYEQMAGAMGKVTAASVGAEKLNNLKGSLDQLKGSLETAAITLGLSLLPMLKGLVDTATLAVNAGIPLLEAWGPKLAAGLGRVGTAILNVAELIGFLIDGSAGFREAAKLFKEFTGIDLAPYEDALKGAAEVTGQFAGLVERAIRGDAGGALVAFVQQTGELRLQLVDAFLGWARAAVEWVVPMIPDLLANLATFLQSLLAAIAQSVAPLVEHLASWAAAFIDWIGPQIPGLLRQLGIFLDGMFRWAVTVALPAIVEKLATWGLAFVEWVAPRIGPLLLELGKLLLAMNQWFVTEALPLIGAELLKLGGRFVSWVGEHVLPKLPGELAKVGDALSAWLNDTSNTIAAKLNEIGALIWRKIAGDSDSFKTIMVEAFGGAIRAAGDAIERAKDLILAPLRSIVDKARDLIDKIKDLIDRAKRLWDNRPKPGDGDAGAEARASGGPVVAGRSYVVGERGPELFMPRSDGTIIPNGGVGGGTVIHVTVNGSVLSERDLTDAIYTSLVRKGLSQGGLSFSGSLV